MVVVVVAVGQVNVELVAVVLVVDRNLVASTLAVMVV